MGGQVFGSDVTARDAQAVTSPANRIATAKQSLGALRAAALGGRGQAAAAKSESCTGFPDGKPIRHSFAVSILAWEYVFQLDP
jgi:hypothetical protein